MKVEPLDDRHDRAHFVSGVDPRDRYLRQQAGQDVRRRVASCFVLVDEGPAPLAYYTLAATSVLLVEVPAAVTKRLPRYLTVPATLLGRLAVDHRHRGQRLGGRCGATSRRSRSSSMPRTRQRPRSTRLMIFDR